MYWEVDYFLRPYGLNLLLLVLCIFQNILHETIKSIFEVANSFIRAALLNCIGDAVLNMMLKNGFAYLVESSTNSGNLCQDIISSSPFFPAAVGGK